MSDAIGPTPLVCKKNGGGRWPLHDPWVPSCQRSYLGNDPRERGRPKRYPGVGACGSMPAASKGEEKPVGLIIVWTSRDARSLSPLSLRGSPLANQNQSGRTSLPPLSVVLRNRHPAGGSSWRTFACSAPRGRLPGKPLGLACSAEDLFAARFIVSFATAPLSRALCSMALTASCSRGLITFPRFSHFSAPSRASQSSAISPRLICRGSPFRVSIPGLPRARPSSPCPPLLRIRLPCPC